MQAELFVFVGRWSNQKGIDLIADVFFSILEQHPKTQLICVGPVIDLYGKFAAVKLAKMMEQYPGRVFSKPEFTALPPCIFGGAEFSLIPSRDEPFGLVAVEFGRKGALGVGARVGGLGNMPGWWYTIESPATKHLLNQFKGAIHTALATKLETRAMMRARSRLQRFPVVQWVEELEKLQSKSISLHKRVEAGRGRSTQRQSRSQADSPSISTAPGSTRFSSAHSTAPNTELNSPTNSRPPSRIRSPSMAQSPSIDATTTDSKGRMSLGRLFGPSNPRSSSQGRSRSSSRTRFGKRRMTPTGTRDGVVNNRVSIVHEGIEDLGIHAQNSAQIHPVPHEGLSIDEEDSSGSDAANGSFPPRFPPLPPLNFEFSPDVSGASTPTAGHRRTPRDASSLGLNSVVGDRKSFKLQKVHPLFTDSTETYYRAFQEKLASINSKTAEDQLCIEEYLVKSEKAWFTRFHYAQMGNSAAASKSATPASSVFRMPWGRASQDLDRAPNETSGSGTSEFLLGDDYEPPTGIKKFLQKKIGDWYLYTFLLAFVSLPVEVLLPFSLQADTSRAKSLLPTRTRLLFSLARTDNRLTSSTL